ncbi:hypothetical protein OS493_017604 [Desmophyllum pertusum]|uniref:Uncharacterized protein n=1 Tax=Desmophyllum pertusum TaxID=174260 RepID=A0A9X0CXF1_9CNID|nr:hypothetical protein OS493_017604 [Desmophyllum pertusum]
MLAGINKSTSQVKILRLHLLNHLQKVIGPRTLQLSQFIVAKIGAVTVKGFNKFVWDFEGSTATGKTENAYGIFASHGSMLIANSEEELKAHDVKKWMGLDENSWSHYDVTDSPASKAKESKKFSPLSSAGGVAYQGT